MAGASAAGGTHRSVVRRAAAAAALLAACAAPLAAHDGTHAQIERATRRIERTPEQADAYLARAELLRLHGEWEAALADIERAAALAPPAPALHRARARVLADLGHWAQAEASLDLALADEPDCAPALAARAAVRVARRLYEAAVADYTRAIAVDPRPAPDLYLARARAVLAGEPGDVASALRGLDEGIERLGPVPALVLDAIELERRRGDVDAALARLQPLIDGAASPERWLARRGDLLREAGRADEARRAYVRALRTIEARPPARRRTGATAELERRVRARLGEAASWVTRPP